MKGPLSCVIVKTTMTDAAGGASAPAGTDNAGGGGAEAAAGTTAPEAANKIAPPVEPAPGGEGGEGGKPKGTTAAEQAARAIRADRTAENPQQSLLDALDDYMVLCGGQPLAEVRCRVFLGVALAPSPLPHDVSLCVVV